MFPDISFSLHLVKAYATLANEGYVVTPTFVLNKKIQLNKNILFKKETSDYFLKSDVRKLAPGVFLQNRTFLS